MNYWIFKSEPGVYGIDHLAAEESQTTRWDGIRNYQARNNLRDGVSCGDLVMFYHSSCRLTGMAGTAIVVSAAYPDPLQFDPDSKYYDVKSTPQQPRWFCVDIQLHEIFAQLVPTGALKANPKTAELSIFSQSRLSVAPASRAQYQAVAAMAR